jgi:hypothetical protein
VAKLTAHRLSGVELPVLVDDEKTIEELQARIKRTIEILESVDPASIAHDPTTELVIKTRASGSFRFDTAQRYVSEYAIPCFHKSATTAFHALASQGVPLEWMQYWDGVLERAE